MRNPFRNPQRRQQFEAMLSDHAARHGCLFHPDGRENHSNNIGQAFWRGYHGQLAAWIDRDMPLHVAYAAGEAVGRSHRAQSSLAQPAGEDAATSLSPVLGYWREPDLRPAPGARIAWIAPQPMGLQVWRGLVAGRHVATIRRQPAHGRSACSASLKGWMWTTHQAGSTAERMAIPESPTRGFSGLRAAKAALQAALSS